MNDWVDNIREILENDSVPLQNGGWERFEAVYCARKRRRRIARWSAIAATDAVVVFVLLIPDSKPYESVASPTELIATIQRNEAILPEEVVEEHQSLVVQPMRFIPQTTIEEKTVEVHLDETVETATKIASPAVAEIVPFNEVVEDNFIEEDSWNWSESETGDKTRVKVSAYYRGTGGRVINNTDNRFSIGLIDQVQKAFPVHYGTEITTETITATHSVPLSLGINMSLQIIPHLEITTGLDMYLYNSRFTRARGDYEIQNAYYLGIPLRLDWVALQNGPVSAWIGAGGKVDRLVFCKFGPATVKDNTFNWSATGVAGIQYELFPRVGLFLEPEVSYYFKPSDPVVQTYRTENPLMFSIGAGFRINL